MCLGVFMGKTNIGFEIDERDLANAKAFVAKNGGSLNKLVAALFASLAREETRNRPAPDPASTVLMQVSAGKISIMEAARQLELPDAGYVFHRLSELGLPLPRLDATFVAGQLSSAQAALDDCLIEPTTAGKKKRGGSRTAARA